MDFAERSKKKKGAIKSIPAEPNNTRVFVWELVSFGAKVP